MSAYIGVGNAARAVRYIYIGVGNTARRVKKAYVGVNNTARLVYKMGSPIANISVGSTVKIKINGVATDFIVVHQGLPSSDYDSSCNGTWVIAKDIYAKSLFGDNNYYEDSIVHTYLNNTFYNLIDAGVRNSIKQVKIPYINKASVAVSGANGLSTSVFLLSGTELGLTSSTMFKTGSVLKLFEDSGALWRISDFEGTASIYWTRSPYKGDSINNFAINSSGTAFLYGISGVFGIRPAIVLSSDTLVDDNNNVI